MVTLHYNNTTKDVIEDSESYLYLALMNRPQLVLKFFLHEFIEFPVGTWCEYKGKVYTLRDSENIRKSGERNIEYNMTMGCDDDNLTIYKVRNTVDHRLKFSMCAKPKEFVKLIVDNLNARDGAGVWSVGNCIDSIEKTIEFNHTYLDAALSNIASTFETETEIEGKVISLHKVEYFRDTPLALSYGKGNGFVAGIGRTTASDEKPIKRLYVQGSDRNIDRSKYGSAELLLPKSQTYVYENRTYKTDPDGFYIERIDKVSDAVKEDSLDCSNIYPSRIGSATIVETVNAAKNFYDIIDTTIPDSLNYNDYVIAGESMTMIFQSGMLAGSGKQFELKYKHAERRFEIVPQEIDGVTMPNETFKPAAGDKYAVFGIQLPDSYICDNASQSGASWDMFKEGCKHLYEHEDQKFTFNGELQALWAKRNWVNVGGKLKVGAYIMFTDSQFAKDGVLIRITGIKEYISSPYSPAIEISNSVSGKTVSSQLQKIDNQEVVISDSSRDIMSFTKRRFRDAQETMDMLVGAVSGFDDSIAPLAVKTMAMLVGDESLQFRFVQSKTSLVSVAYNIAYDNASKTLSCPAGFLQHMTLGINSISPTHKDSEYKVWQMSAFTSGALSDTSKKYYLYAKVGTETSANGIFLLSEETVDMTSVSGYYHLLCGVVNKEIDGTRSFVTLYGYTEILPSRITTDKIISSDGNSYFDLSSNSFKLGDELSYNTDGNKTLRLKFLAAENSNLGGFIIKNGRLESQNGSVYLDGTKGEARLAGTIQLSTAFSGSFTDANIFYLPAITTTANISMGVGVEHIGKVVRLYNSSGFSGAYYRITLYTFTQQKDSGSTSGIYTYNAIVRPQETIELTCLEIANTDTQRTARWEITSRFSQEMFLTEGAVGRYPRMVALGTVIGTDTAATLSGSFWNGSTISSILSVSRLSTGRYKISFTASNVPNGYTTIVSGRGTAYGGSTAVKASVVEYASTYFVVDTADDDTSNDGSFDFMILVPLWNYTLI